jgi:hypothetical protein
MIMPANYSVIAENELSYVEGGAFNFYVDPISDGGKTLANNIVTWIGNAYTTDVLNAFVGVWFKPQTAAGLKSDMASKIKSLFSKNAVDGEGTLGTIQHYVSNTVGVASAIWILGTKSVVSAAAPTKLSTSKSATLAETIADLQGTEGIDSITFTYALN